MAALFTSLAAALITDKPAPGGPQLYELMVDASLGHAPAPRAHSPLRKHKRKAAVPHRSALDTAVEEAAPLAWPEAEVVESRPKERRGSASPPAAPRPPRPQRAAAQQPLPPPGDAAGAAPGAPAPQDLAAMFAAAAPPPFLAAAAAAADNLGAPKVCVQCGTMATPMWRTVNGLNYCNADGLRLKRKLGLL